MDIPSRRQIPKWSGPVLVAFLATLAVMATLAPSSGGPGVTCDELYHVHYGKQLVTALRHQGLSFFSPVNIEANFAWKPDGPPVHPPLGNFLLGWAHHLFDLAPDDPLNITVTTARFAPALAFGLLVLLVGGWTVRVEGPAAGTFASMAVALVPRMFGHAHLAALDMLTTLLFVAAILAVAEATRRGNRAWHFILAGIVLGLALLTRIHGLLIVPPVVLWLLLYWRRKALLPLLVWGMSAVVTFFLGWPWLWLDPIGRIKLFLGSATLRQSIHVFYAGQVWDDIQTPWHYPLVMFLVVLPLGLLLLGVLGLWAKRNSWKSDPSFSLILGTCGFLLIVFSWPGVPVYDGVRLFLPCFALWAVAVAVGASWMVDQKRLARLFDRPVRTGVVGLFLVLQGVGIMQYNPCYLSHYSVLVGGLAGADKLGFETTYWGDSIEETLLAELAELAAGQNVCLLPSLAPFHPPAVQLASESLVSNRVTLMGGDGLGAMTRYAVVFRRKADLASSEKRLHRAKVLVEYCKQGVWLTRIVEINRPLNVGASKKELP